MKTDRAKNAGRNILFGAFLKGYQIAVPFVMRTVMIYFMGVRYLGINGLFASVLQVLNLAELGVGSAMVYSMYKPVAENDHGTICALMALYRKYYRIIGIVIFAAGLAVCPFLPCLVKMDSIPPEVDIYTLYFMNLAATVLTYWLFAYKNCLLNAHQRSDVSSKISMVSATFIYILQVTAVCLWRNFYIYTAVVLAGGIVNNLITAYIVGRMYPQYSPKGVLERTAVEKINRRVRDLFTSKLGSVVFDSVDTLIISSFLGMTALAVYQNYFFILSSLNGFIVTIFSALTAGIGNSIIMESNEKNYGDLRKLTFFIFWVGTVCCACMLCLYQPFMKLWVGETLMMDAFAVVCLVVYFFVRQVNGLLNLYKDAAGIWSKDRFRPLLVSLLNLIFSLILVQKVGISGVLLGTVLSIVCVGEPWLLYNLFTNLFPTAYLKKYVMLLLKYCLVCAGVCGAVWLVHRALPQCGSLLGLIGQGGLVFGFSNVLLYLLYRKKPELAQLAAIGDRVTNKKFHKIIGRLAAEK